MQCAVRVPCAAEAWVHSPSLASLATPKPTWCAKPKFSCASATDAVVLSLLPPAAGDAGGAVLVVVVLMMMIPILPRLPSLLAVRSAPGL